MKQVHLECILDVLSKSRMKLIEDYINESPDIYIAAYKFEKNSQLMTLSREKYFISWLGNHWNIFLDKLDNNISHEERDTLQKAFSAIFITMLSKFTFIKESSPEQLQLGITLVRDIKNTFEKFIVAGINSETHQQKLSLFLEKNKKIFDRKIEQLENEL